MRPQPLMATLTGAMSHGFGRVRVGMGSGQWAMRARMAQDYSSARHADVAARETHLFDQCIAAAARARRVGG